MISSFSNIIHKKFFICLRLLMAVTLCSFAFEEKHQTPAYQVKAAFLYNFSHFIEWPANAFSSGSSPFVIGVLGPDPFGSYLDQIVEDEKVGLHPIIIKRYDQPGEVQQCHILFINHPHANEFVKRFANRSILTVSDAEGFASNGGIIRFLTDKSRTRLQVNNAAARAANLSISAKLLRIAEIVEQ